MENLRHIRMDVIAAFLLLLTVAASGPATAAELFVIPTEDAQEFYLLEGEIEPAPLDALFGRRARLTLTSEDTLADPSWQTQPTFTSVPFRLELRSPPPASSYVAWGSHDGFAILSF